MQSIFTKFCFPEMLYILVKFWWSNFQEKKKKKVGIINLYMNDYVVRLKFKHLDSKMNSINEWFYNHKLRIDLYARLI